MTTRVDLPEGKYRLSRLADRRGDSGPWIEAFDWTTRQGVEQRALLLGKGVRCGSPYGRTLHAHDWWLCTPITEFLEISDDKKYVKFKTESGSTYEVKVL